MEGQKYNNRDGIRGGDTIALTLDIKGLVPDRRERIATMALQGLLSDPEVGGDPDALAKEAILYADALIAELEKE